MSRLNVNWYTKPTHGSQRNMLLDLFKRYRRNQGLHNKTIILYTGRVKAFLDYAAIDTPELDIADKYRETIINKGLSRSHINNSCFATRKSTLLSDLLERIKLHFMYNKKVCNISC